MDLAKPLGRYHTLGRLLYELDRRYGPLPKGAVVRLSQLTLEELESIRARAPRCRTLEEALDLS
jgi:hypothetical protein